MLVAATVGIQKNRIRPASFLTLLMRRKKKKNRGARTQNTGESKSPETPPATAPTPVCLCGLKSRTMAHNVGMNSAVKIAPRTMTVVLKDFISN